MPKKISLQEHIRLSREAFEANKNKGNRHAELLAGMYADPARFLEELLQNAEDACATMPDGDGRILIRLSDHGMDFCHNGRIFDEDDLKALTTFGRSNKQKKQGLFQIGRFGVGFKSVFAVTSSPEIHSGPWNFRISGYEVLEECTPRTPPEGYTTLIRLPFPENSLKTTYETVRRGIISLKPELLLFIPKTASIIAEEHGQVILHLKKEITSAGNSLKYVNLYSEENLKSFLLFSSIKKRKIQNALAFCLSENEFLPVESTPMFVWFPTLVQSGLRFYAHGCFTTTPHREQIVFGATNPDNDKMLASLAALLTDAMHAIIRNGLFHPSLLKILPLKPDNPAAHPSIYCAFAEAVHGMLKTIALIPGNNGKLWLLHELVHTDDPAWSEAIRPEMLKILFLKREWTAAVLSDESYVRTISELAAYHSLSQTDARGIAFRLSLRPEILETLPINRLLKLYKAMAPYPMLWDAYHSGEYFSLRTKAFLRDNKGRMQPLADNSGQTMVFLPPAEGNKESGIPILHPGILADKELSDFVGKLEMEVANQISTAFYILSRYFASPSDALPAEYQMHIRRICNAWLVATPSQKELLSEKLRQSFWVQTDDSNGSESPDRLAAEKRSPANNLLKKLKACLGQEEYVLFISRCLPAEEMEVHFEWQQEWQPLVAADDAPVQSDFSAETETCESFVGGLLPDISVLPLMPGSDRCLPVLPWDETSMERIQQWSLRYATRVLKQLYADKTQAQITPLGDGAVFVIRNESGEQYIYVCAAAAFMEHFILGPAAQDLMISRKNAESATRDLLLLIKNPGTRHCCAQFIANPSEFIGKKRNGGYLFISLGAV